VYRHLFIESNGNHVFPLIAAHGALWAAGYFRFGLCLGEVLSWQFIGQPKLRRQKIEQLAVFADRFRDVNRQVCIDSYVNYHFTRRFGNNANAAQFVPKDLLVALNQLHAATDEGRELNEFEKEEVFTAHFLHEQANVVGPTIERAVTDLDWPIACRLALMPIVKFAYFRKWQYLRFSNFANREERIANGLRAFKFGFESGWDSVDQALQNYQLLPTAYFADPARFFQEFRNSAIATA
jgi:hypothetical protein